MTPTSRQSWRKRFSAGGSSPPRRLPWPQPKTRRQLPGPVSLFRRVSARHVGLRSDHRRLASRVCCAAAPSRRRALRSCRGCRLHTRRSVQSRTSLAPGCVFCICTYSPAAHDTSTDGSRQSSLGDQNDEQRDRSHCERTVQSTLDERRFRTQWCGSCGWRLCSASQRASSGTVRRRVHATPAPPRHRRR